MGILNGFLVDPELGKHNLFFFRDQAHVQRSGVPVHKRKHFVPTSEYGREAIEKLREQLRNVEQVRGRERENDRERERRTERERERERERA